MKAKLIKSLRLNGKIVSPKEGSVILTELDTKEFNRLEALGKVAKPSSDDLKIGQLVGAAADEAETQGDYEGLDAAQRGADAKATEDKAAPTSSTASELTKITATEIKGRSKQTEAKAAAPKADDEL